MKLLLPFGLLVALAVVGPIVAHLLRRRRPEERPFPPARLVPRAPPVARRRAYLEDRALLGLRSLAILALAFLAAAPFVRCSSLSLDRRGGASVALAIVIDDSMSMGAELPRSARRDGARTRFDLAMVAARELGASLRSGDSVSIVLAGAPARVVLPASTDMGVVRATLEQIASEGVSDRATDLDGALALAAGAMRELPHPDRRVVLLSDLADGQPQALAAGTSGPAAEKLEIAAPVDALRLPPPNGLADCAVVLATPEADVGARDAVRVRLACSLHGALVAGRSVEIVTADGAQTVAGSAPLPLTFAQAPATFELVIPVDRAKAKSLEPVDGKPSLLARLAGPADALARDDLAPVLGGTTAPAIGVVVAEGGAADEIVATGGAPILERALRALESGSPIRPLPSIPDRAVDLAPYAGLAIDDPPGFAPETRDALAHWIERGGVLLVGCGPRVASPPLGASLEPALARAVRWERFDKPPVGLGVDPAHAGPFANGAEPPLDLAPHGRAQLDREDVEHAQLATAWKDGAPLLLRHSIGEGEAWIVGLPFSADVSDLPLRPGYLALLDAWVARARDRGAGTRLEAGQAWSAGPDDVLDVVALDARGAKQGAPLAVERTPDARRVRPRAVGAYGVTLTPKGGTPRKDVRAVAPVPREVDLAPRPLAPTVASGDRSGLERATVPLGPVLAVLVTAIAAIELLVRLGRMLFTRPKPSREGHDDVDVEPAT
jgi:hypothetical protein